MIWKRKKKKVADNSRPHQLSMRIATAILKVQCAWAKWMQSQSERLSTRTKWFLLVFTSLIMCFYCLGLVTGVIKEGYKSKGLSTEMKAPHIGTPNTNIPGKLPPDATYGRIMAFRRYLDSLKSTEEGRQKLDSIAAARPGLAHRSRSYSQEPMHPCS